MSAKPDRACPALVVLKNPSPSPCSLALIRSSLTPCLSDGRSRRPTHLARPLHTNVDRLHQCRGQDLHRGRWERRGEMDGEGEWTEGEGGGGQKTELHVAEYISRPRPQHLFISAVSSTSTWEYSRLLPGCLLFHLGTIALISCSLLSPTPNPSFFLWCFTPYIVLHAVLLPGTIAQWYFAPVASELAAKPGGRVGRSLSAAFGPSFGSLCFGGLILTIVSILRTVRGGGGRGGGRAGEGEVGGEAGSVQHPQP